MARCLRELGWPVEIVTACENRESAREYDGLVHYVPAMDKPLIFRISTMLATLRHVRERSSDGDIIIINEDSLWLMPFFRLLGRRHVHLDIRTFPVTLQSLKQRLNRLLFWTLPVQLLGRKANTYSFITRRLREAFVEEFGNGWKPDCIWESGVNLAMFRDSTMRQPENDRFTVFYHGSLYLSRGIPELIEAMAQFRGDTNIRLVVVGDGPEMAQLHAQIAQLNVADLVEFRGFVPYEQVVAEIGAADVCICPLPDRPEWNMSSPLKVLEYMACAKPMILTPIPAHRDIAGDSPFVVWSEGSSPQELARAIRSAHANITALRDAASQAPDVVAGRYEWRSHTQVLAQTLAAGAGAD